jgi:hypothetical protein
VYQGFDDMVLLSFASSFQVSSSSPDKAVPEFKSSHKPIVLRKNHEYDGQINETWDNYFSGTA